MTPSCLDRLSFASVTILDTFTHLEFVIPYSIQYCVHGTQEIGESGLTQT